MALDDAWFALRRKSASGGGGGGARWTTTPGSFTSGHGVKGFGGDGAFQLCQRVRHDMAFVVNNWFTYLQVDVVEAQYRVMIERVEASEGDFSECQRAHRAFLAALTAQSFLDLPSVSDVIETIMRLAGNLLAVVKSLPSEGVEEGVGERRRARSRPSGRSSPRQSAALYTVLRSNRLANDPKAPFLRTLLLRLNFNGVLLRQRGENFVGTRRGRERRAVGAVVDVDDEVLQEWLGRGDTADAVAVAEARNLD